MNFPGQINPQMLAMMLQRGGPGAGGMPGGIQPGQPGQPPGPNLQRGPPDQFHKQEPAPPFQPPPNSMFMGFLPGVSQGSIPKGKSTDGLDLTTRPGMAGVWAPNHYSDS